MLDYTSEKASEKACRAYEQPGVVVAREKLRETIF